MRMRESNDYLALKRRDVRRSLRSRVGTLAGVEKTQELAHEGKSSVKTVGRGDASRREKK